MKLTDVINQVNMEHFTQIQSIHFSQLPTELFPKSLHDHKVNLKREKKIETTL